MGYLRRDTTVLATDEPAAVCFDACLQEVNNAVLDITPPQCLPLPAFPPNFDSRSVNYRRVLVPQLKIQPQLG